MRQGSSGAGRSATSGRPRQAAAKPAAPKGPRTSAASAKRPTTARRPTGQKQRRATEHKRATTTPVRRAKRPQPRADRRPLRWGRLLVAALVLVVLAGAVLARGTWEVRTTMLAETTFETQELAAELRVLQITDFHNIARPAQVRDIVDLVREAAPDLIALTGDLVNTRNQTLDPVRRLLDGLSHLDAPRYYVDGNHDHWSPDQARLHDLLARHGVTVLTNAATTLQGGFGTVHVIGVDDYYTGHGDLGRAVEGLPADGFRLVLTHSPGILPDLGAHDIDYAMCGHTHGGQIRLPLIGAIYQPGGEWFPRISKGAYSEGGSTLFVDSGAGVTGPKLRLFNQSQVTLHRIGPDVGSADEGDRGTGR